MRIKEHREEVTSQDFENGYKLGFLHGLRDFAIAVILVGLFSILGGTISHIF